MAKKTVHLLCNAHLDPIWLWEWEEGAAEAISTFRTAADFCEQFDGFIFNHNEVVLYKWVEEYEPALFMRIQKLVKEKKWHIMGGWYVQPDCNMPSGESFVRQGLMGKRYFKDKFGVDVKTAINFDPFGHTQGLPQILIKLGYNAYLFCRPGQDDCALPSDDFVWVGYDGSEILAHRASSFYASGLGHARPKVEGWMNQNPDKECGLILWGVGNHGGGASRQDLENLKALISETKDRNIKHSNPDEYFKEMESAKRSLPRHAKDINPWAVGCYTSIIRIKQRHRLLENEIYAVEKMASNLWSQGILDYPELEIHDALEDLLLCEFHDVLPGSCTQPSEESALRTIDHALEIVSRVKARAFFALAGGQPKPAEGMLPIFVYNPHPYKVRRIVECEFQLPDQNWSDDKFNQPTVTQGKKTIPSQVEKEESSIPIDWRKRVVFEADLEPSLMNRFDCKFDLLPTKPKPELKINGKKIQFKTEDLDVAINAKTGLIDAYKVRGVDYLSKNAFLPLVIQDDVDPWGMRVKNYRNVAGAFALMSPERSARFSGITAAPLQAVRIIEDGDVRTVVEAVFEYGDSALCQRYKLPKKGTQIEVDLRVYWNEKDKMLKLSIPTHAKKCRYVGQVAYGVGELPSDGREAVAQKWVAVLSDKDDRAFTCVNDGVYGSDYSEDGLRITLLRSPGYSAHPINDRQIVPQDRFTPRIDQGERLFRFWVNAGSISERLESIDREALAINEKPFSLSFYPCGFGEKPKQGLVLSDPVVQVCTIKKAEKGKALVIRFFEPTGKARATRYSIPALGIKGQVKLKAFEIKTLKIDLKTGKAGEVNLLEK